MIQELVGKRFSSLKTIEEDLKLLGATMPRVHYSESIKFVEQDFMIDGTLDIYSQNDEDYFTLFYLKDNAGNYFITEANYW